MTSEVSSITENSKHTRLCARAHTHRHRLNNLFIKLSKFIISIYFFSPGTLKVQSEYISLLSYSSFCLTVLINMCTSLIKICRMFRILGLFWDCQVTIFKLLKCLFFSYNWQVVPFKFPHWTFALRTCFFVLFSELAICKTLYPSPSAPMDISRLLLKLTLLMAFCNTYFTWN